MSQPALVTGRHYITERDYALVQYNGIVLHTRYWYTVVLWLTLVVTNHKSRLCILKERDDAARDKMAALTEARAARRLNTSA